jgi:hypothetical protein
MSACSSDIVARIATKIAFDGWKNGKELALSSDPLGTPPRRLPTPAEIPAIQVDIFNTGNCLEEKIRGLTGLATADSNTQLHIESLQKQIADEKRNIEIAKERLSTVKDKQTSYYESWFPIERDIRPRSYSILIGISAALCFISIAYLFQLMGIYIFVQRIGSSYDLGLSALMQQFTISFWIVLAALIGVVLYFVYK